jgi:hypothetical protein
VEGLLEDVLLDDELFDEVPEPEPEPESEPDAELESELELELESEPDDPELPVVLGLSPATFFFLPVLKSVSYQPSPFRRNPAADTSLFSLSSLQIGQTFNGSSESF